MFALTSTIILFSAVLVVEAALCDPLPGINCWGNDLSSPNGQDASTAAACCAQCSARAGCRAWSWNEFEGNPPGACWLKVNCNGVRNDTGAISGTADPIPPPSPSPSPGPYPPPSDYHNGVSMGGWLLTEPSWMYDQFSAPAEGDLVLKLRAQGGDAFAIQTMRNHWSNYYPDAALDALVKLGVTHARVPIGYWIIEAPVVIIADTIATQSPDFHTFGFNHEGFVTGGINYLEIMLAKLKTRGIKVLIDVHALPGGSSSCQSYSGWQVSDPLFWRASPPPSNMTIIPTSCGGAGPYRTTRGSSQTWMETGEDTVVALSNWIVSLQSNASMSDTVVGFEIANEPGLGFNGVQDAIQTFCSDMVPKVQAIFKNGQVNVNVTLNFIGPNDVYTGTWVASQISAGKFDSQHLLIDFHNYYNWNGPLTWQQLATQICATVKTTSPWSQYTDNNLHTVIGEWSCSTNYGAKPFTDLTNPEIVAHLRILYANQMSLFSARGGATPGCVGQHHWALRMGSGWDPRPTVTAPNGTQVEGSAWDKSLTTFQTAVWSLGELIRVGVAQPLDALNVTGVCVCNGCSANGAAV